MFAIIRTGGKQYKVAKNDVIFVEKLDGEEGGEVRFDEVLMIGDADARTVGTPTVAGAAVTATVLEQARRDKIIVFKKKRRKGYRRKRGHRQAVTVLRITDIQAEATAPVPAEAAPTPAAAPTPETAPAPTTASAEAAPETEKAAAKKPAATKKTPARKAASGTAKKAEGAAAKKKAPARKKTATAKPAATTDEAEEG